MKARQESGCESNLSLKTDSRASSQLSGDLTTAVWDGMRRKSPEARDQTVPLSSSQQFPENMLAFAGKGKFQVDLLADLKNDGLRGQLCKIAEQKMPWWMRNDFKKDIDRFEQRAIDQNLALGQRADFYNQVVRLLKAAPAWPQDGGPGWHLILAEQIMSYAADPTKIDQGYHKTCGAAALESEMFTLDPADASKLIADVFLTGKFVPSGARKPVVPDRSILQPDDEANRNPPRDAQRSFASQLFQGTAITMEYPGYRQVRKYNSWRFDGRSSADEVVVGSRQTKRGPVAVVEEFDGLYPYQIRDMSKKIAGNRNPLAIIESRDIHIFDGLIHVGSNLELIDQLKKLQAQRRLPALVFVDTNHEPFWTDGCYGQRRRSGGGHFICITDLQRTTPESAAIDNQWGVLADHRQIPVQEVYLSLQRSRSGGWTGDLEQAVEQNRKAGHTDTALELELLRQQRVNGIISVERFVTGLEETMQRFDKRQDAGMISVDEQARIIDAAHQIYDFHVLTQLDELQQRWKDITHPEQTFKSSSKPTLKELLHERITGEKSAIPRHVQEKGSWYPVHDRSILSKLGIFLDSISFS